jgi:NAD(P)-dependent dehydrogenase (short-subunit alcohol dehydrogenase family)
VLTPGEEFGEILPEVLERTLATNTVAPLMLAQLLLPLLAKGDRPRILNIGSALGSVARTQRFGTPSYNISKAGLNMAGTLMARALNPQGIGVLTISPGWVRTDMGGSSAELTPEESVRDVLATLEKTPGVPEGTFLDRKGEPLPW